VNKSLKWEVFVTPDSPRIIEETRQYIRDFDGVAGQPRRAEDSTTRRWSSIRIGSIRGSALAFGARGQTAINRQNKGN